MRAFESWTSIVAAGRSRLERGFEEDSREIVEGASLLGGTACGNGGRCELRNNFWISGRLTAILGTTLSSRQPFRLLQLMSQTGVPLAANLAQLIGKSRLQGLDFAGWRAAGGGGWLTGT